ncbi:MAG: hypothetical protein ACUVSF_10750 [Anaerolineae bacterium]
MIISNDLRRLFWAVLLLLGFISLILIGLRAAWLLGSEGQFVNLVRPGPATALVRGVELGQTFVAPRAGLHRIDVLLYGYYRHNTQPVTFHLRKVGAGEDTVTITFSAGEVWGWHWKHFEFPPLSDSAGQSYYFFFESPTSTPQDSITLGGVEGDLYPYGTAVINGQPAFADASFVTHYTNVSTVEKLSALADKLTRAKPSLWGDVRFYVLLGVIYLLLVGRLMSEIYRLRH